MRLQAFALSLAALALAATPASARPLGQRGASIQDVATVLQAQGMSVSYSSNSHGQTIISQSGGVNFDIWFMDCSGNSCRSFEMGACFSMDPAVSLDRINGWNLEQRYSRAYRTTTPGEVCIASDALVAHGSTEQIGAHISEFTRQLGGFASYIGFNVSSSGGAGSSSSSSSSSAMTPDDVIRALRDTPNADYGPFNRNIAAVMTAAYDSNNSGMIDTGAEVDRIPCSVLRALQARLQQHRGATLGVTLGFAPGYGYVGHVVGFNESVRERTYVRLDSCGMGAQ